jgi:hypothetical protein
MKIYHGGTESTELHGEKGRPETGGKETGGIEPQGMQMESTVGR